MPSIVDRAGAPREGATLSFCELGKHCSRHRAKAFVLSLLGGAGQQHLNKLAERKADREAAKRLAKGLSTSPTDYPWLKEEGWVDRQPVKPFKRR